MTRPALGDPEPARVPMSRVVGALTIAWAFALAATLLVPSWHEGGRHWWPWAAVCGLSLGLIGLVVVRDRT